VLLAHPAAAVGALGRGLTATLGADLSYLPSAPVTPASVPAVLGTTVGPQGADRAQLLAWLAGLPVPWLPAAVVAAGVLAGLLTLRRRATAVGRALGRVAAVAAVSAVGVVAAAVLGDGYFEIAKHVWLAAYLLVVTAAAVVLGAAVSAASRTSAGFEARERPARAAYRRRPPPSDAASRADAAAAPSSARNGGLPGV
jgi:hypothetical protein